PCLFCLSSFPSFPSVQTSSGFAIFDRRKNLGRQRSLPVGDRCRPFSLWSGRNFGVRPACPPKRSGRRVRRASYFFAFLAVFLVDFFVAFFAVFFAAA